MHICFELLLKREVKGAKECSRARFLNKGRNPRPATAAQSCGKCVAETVVCAMLFFCPYLPLQPFFRANDEELAYLKQELP